MHEGVLVQGVVHGAHCMQHSFLLLLEHVIFAD